MTSAAITAAATALLVLVGFAQIGVLLTQRRLRRLDLAEASRARWADCQDSWATTVFIGREIGAYYQVAGDAAIEKLKERLPEIRSDRPSVWALDSIRAVTGLLSDTCLRVLQGQIYVSDAYTVFGTELLRHSRPLRVICDPQYGGGHRGGTLPRTHEEKAHDAVLKEVQDWLIYHDGIRRRCLILIDLLWAEAARVEDLPPADLRSAANAKRETGSLNRQRVQRECRRLLGVRGLFRGLRLGRHLRHAEYKRLMSRIGLREGRLDELQELWEERLLHRHRT